MKYIVILSALALTGCGAFDRGYVWFTGDASEVCKRGVLYYQFTSGSAPAYKADGALITCN